MLCKRKYYKIKSKKELGQNFLPDNTIPKKIIKYIDIDHDSQILEIGTGTGVITSSILLHKPMKIVSIEIDKSLKKYPIYSIKNPKLKIIFADAIRIEEETLFKKKCKIIAGLPYNISTILILKWLKKIDLFEEIILIVQKEIAESITADKGNKKFSKLSVVSQLVCKCEILFNIKSNNFYPIPKVASSVVRMIPYKKKIKKEEIYKLEETCKKIFNQKRKKISNIIKNNFKNTEEIVKYMSYKKDLRPEKLSIEELHKISRFIKK